MNLSHFFLGIILFASLSKAEFKLPVSTYNRSTIESIELTKIGEFGLLRKARPEVAAHYHAGIDIKRPSKNYVNEKIYPIDDGIVISIRDDGPFAQIIVEHAGNEKFWTVYEHVSGIEVDLFDDVNPDKPIARFMNKSELDKYGWQFDHLHFEVLKVKPLKLKPAKNTPKRLFSSYSLTCKTKVELNKYFYNPIEFLTNNLK
ncbi:MAG: M23 family metallopeptidase [Bacteroidia bacterium]